MALSKQQIESLYNRRASHYDLAAQLYMVIGFKEARYRQMAISELALKPGDTVVDIGCGTGLNFESIMACIGETGHLIGVDLTPSMLEMARKRASTHGWENLELIQADAASFDFPRDVNAVLTTYALTLMPEYETIVARASDALVTPGRLVVLDFRKPDGWPLWLVKIGVLITKPFGVSLDLSDRKPWKSMEKHFQKVWTRPLFGGFAYIAVGEK